MSVQTIARVSVETIARNKFYGQILQDITDDAVDRLVRNINILNHVESGPFYPAVNVILSIIEICFFSMFKIDYFHFKTNHSYFCINYKLQKGYKNTILKP